MKILQIIGGAERGGSRSHVLNLCQALRDKGVGVEIVCLLDGPVAQGARELGIPVTVYPMRQVFDFRAVRFLRARIRAEKPDIVHTHGVRANFIGRLAARGTDIPVITTVHSSIYHDYAHPLKKLFYHRIEKVTRPLTKRFIAVSKSLQKELEADGIPSAKISVIYNGIKPEREKSAQSLRRELGIGERTPVLMTVGRMERVKNQALFLRILARLKRGGILFHAVLIGDGPLLPELQELAVSLGLAEVVSFPGFRSNASRLLQEATIFVLTSEMEGLPLTLLEAMNAGVPVVVTAVGGMPEVVNLAQNGCLVPAGDEEIFVDSLRELLFRPDLRREMAAKGLEALLKHFTIEKFVSATLKVYREVLKETGRKEVAR